MAPHLQRRISPLITLGTFILLVAALYLGRPILMPLALAFLFTFLLNPIVDKLRRRGLGRVPSVILVVFVLSILLSGITWTIGLQVGSLAAELPLYKDNIRKKIADLRSAGKGTAIERVQKTFQELAGEIERDQKIEEATRSGGQTVTNASEKVEKPVPVVVRGDESIQRLLPSGLGSIMEWMANLGLVIVLVIFILIRFEELRNRLFRLVGYSRLTTTTKALDEAAERISRYLLMQTIINATYGVSVAIGLYFIGLPYAILWGFLAFSARFIPYVGPMLGVLLPVLLSLAVFDGWLYPLLVIGLFLILELGSNMFMEPWLYGQSVGVSEVALIVAIAFWTWIWGPIGLALATPLTVCIVVLCKYIPELEFVEVLMGDEPSTDSCIVFYQRLLASDQDEANRILQEYVKNHPGDSIYDDVLIPALTCAKRDLSRDRLSEKDQRFVFRTMNDLIENMDAESPPPDHFPPLENGGRSASPRSLILGHPAHDAADGVALSMFKRLVEAQGYVCDIMPSNVRHADVLNAIKRRNPASVCIVALPPDPLTPVEQLCRRIKEQFPRVRVMVGRWGWTGGFKDQQARLQAARADAFSVTLTESVKQLRALLETTQGYPLAAEEEQRTREGVAFN